MKTIALTTFAVFFFISSFAQSQKLTIYCWVDREGRFDYGDLKKWLPESIQKEVMVYMKKDNFYERGVSIMYMTMHGWNLVGPDPDVSGTTGSTGTDPTYMFSREVDVDDKTMTVLKDRLIALSATESTARKHRN